eukprot:364311-Chlamydomonas_euryale.AAC.3
MVATPKLIKACVRGAAGRRPTHAGGWGKYVRSSVTQPLHAAACTVADGGRPGRASRHGRLKASAAEPRPPLGKPGAKL